MKKSFEQRITSCLQAVNGLREIEQQIQCASSMLAAAIQKGRRIYTCGNGGSAAESSHLATELSGRYRSNRSPMPAVSLVADGTALTCIGNDFGWDNVFARQIEAHANAGDVLIALTTSGNSPNVLAALEAAKKAGMITIGLLGGSGGKAQELCEIPIIVPSFDTGSIQEAHLVAIHILCEALEPETSL